MPTISGYGGYTGGLTGSHVPLPRTPQPIRQRTVPVNRFSVPLLNPTEFSNEQVAKAYTVPKRRGRDVRQRSARSDKLARPMIEKIVKLYGEGKSIRDVAAELGCATSTVRRYLEDEGVERRPKHSIKKPLPASETPRKICEAPGCGTEFGRREGERLDTYRRRSCCTPTCGGRLAAAKRRGEIAA